MMIPLRAIRGFLLLVTALSATLLAAERPNIVLIMRVEAMAKQWSVWASRVGVMPWPLGRSEDKKAKGKGNVN
jgi:hypothetical protein